MAAPESSSKYSPDVGTVVTSEFTAPTKFFKSFAGSMIGSVKLIVTPQPQVTVGLICEVRTKAIAPEGREVPWVVVVPGVPVCEVGGTWEVLDALEVRAVAGAEVETAWIPLVDEVAPEEVAAVGCEVGSPPTLFSAKFSSGHDSKS